MMKTYSPKPEHIERSWYVVDASGQVLGRLASEVATLLRGKHKPIFAPHMDTGDHVVVINADKVELSGNKGQDKFAYRHSGYPGGITGIRYADLLATRPVAAVEKAVRGMLPKNRLGRQQIKKLHVVAGAEHPHAAQMPVELAVGQRPTWSGLPAVKPAPAGKSRTAATSPPSRKRSDAAPADGRSTTAGERPSGSAGPTSGAKKRAAKPAAKEQPTATSGAKTSTASKTSAQKPATKTPTAKKPTAKKPTAKKPTAKKPTAKKPTAKKTTAKKPAAKKPATNEE
jgi:large subunit ribosomal protein L13